MDTIDDYQIRFYESGEEQEIVDLLSLVFTEWKVRGEQALDHWRWLYQDNPLGPCNVAVAVKGHEIAGVSHELHLYTKVGNVIEKTLYTTDVAVHPEHRRRGLHNRMQAFRFLHREDYGFQYSYSTSKILIERNTRKLREGNDPHQLFPVEINRYLLIRDIDLHLEKKKTDYPWIMKQGYILKKIVSTIKTHQGSNISADNIEINETHTFNDADSFWDKIQSKYNFIAMKNQLYLEWRYSDPRSGDYHMFSAHKDHEYCGYVVASIDHETPDYPMGNIIDFLTNGDEFVDRMLLGEALSCLEGYKVNAVSAYVVKDSHVSHVLESMGFIDRGDPLYTTYRIPDRHGATHPDIEKIAVNQIHLMYSDFYVK